MPIGSPRANSIMARSANAPLQRPEIRLQSEPLALAEPCPLREESRYVVRQLVRIASIRRTQQLP